MASGSTRESGVSGLGRAPIAFVPARGAVVLGVDEQRDATDIIGDARMPAFQMELPLWIMSSTWPRSSSALYGLATKGP